jgi:hypothetical protein
MRARIVLSQNKRHFIWGKLTAHQVPEIVGNYLNIYNDAIACAPLLTFLHLQETQLHTPSMGCVEHSSCQCCPSPASYQAYHPHNSQHTYPGHRITSHTKSWETRYVRRLTLVVSASVLLLTDTLQCIMHASCLLSLYFLRDETFHWPDFGFG